MVKRELRVAVFRIDQPCRIPLYMPRKSSAYGKSYLRDHRLHVGLTQDQVVARLEIFGTDHPEAVGRLPKTAASLSRLENGQQPYSQPILEALALVYGVEPGDLISKKPGVHADVIDLTQRLNDAQREQLVAFARGMLATG